MAAWLGDRLQMCPHTVRCGLTWCAASGNLYSSALDLFCCAVLCVASGSHNCQALANATFLFGLYTAFPLQPYDKEIDEKANSGIVVPLLPFGIKKYDEVGSCLQADGRAGPDAVQRGPAARWCWSGTYNL